MTDKVYINSEFSKTLQNLNCKCKDDYITITRYENDKVFFKYGKCKLHVTKAELESYKIESQ
jgi:hypothetical protein